MDNQVLRIEKLTNGYEVEICDPEVMKKNRDPKNKGPWEDPWKGYAFTTAEEVKNFVGQHLDSLSPPPEADDEYADAFAKESAKDD